MTVFFFNNNVLDYFAIIIQFGPSLFLSFTFILNRSYVKHHKTVTNEFARMVPIRYAAYGNCLMRRDRKRGIEGEREEFVQQKRIASVQSMSHTRDSRRRCVCVCVCLLSIWVWFCTLSPNNSILLPLVYFNSSNTDSIGGVWRVECFCSPINCVK